MTLFVTGGTGFIGSHFLKAALAAGHRLRTLRRSENSRPRIPLEAEPEWLTKEMPDVTVEDLRGANALVHLAAAGVSPQEANAATLHRVNVTESAELWQQAVKAGARRFVICGSCFEYGKSAERYEFIPTNAPLEPTTPYGASKAAASTAALTLAQEKKLELIVLRPFHVFGEGQHEANFWPSLKAAALSGKDFPMTPGEQWRDFIPVEQIATAFVRAVTRTDIQPGKPLIENLGAGAPQTLKSFAGHWWKHWNARGKLLVGALPYRSGEVMRYVPALAKRERSLH